MLPSVVSVLTGRWGLLFVGDDWAEDHHDVELVDEAGRRLARARLPEGVVGITRLHELVAAHTPQDAEPGEVVVGIETDRGPWVGALLAAGYQVYAINPMQVARYRERHSTSGAKSDAADAHVLAELVRLDRAAHRPIAGDSDLAEATQAGRPRAPDPDLGPAPAAAAPSGRAAGVLPRRAARVRRLGRPRCPGAAGRCAGPGKCGPAVAGAHPRRADPSSPAAS